MWCRECHKEVNVRTAGSASGTCPVCGQPIVVQSKPDDAVRQAREILERWQSSDLFERITSTGPLTSVKPSPINVRNEAKSVPFNLQPDTTPAPVSLTPTGHWDALVAPLPLLATSAPPLTENENSPEAAAIPVLVHGVEEFKRTSSLSLQASAEPITAQVSERLPGTTATGAGPAAAETRSSGETPSLANPVSSALSVPMTTAMVREDSATAVVGPAESANVPQPAASPVPTKSERNPMRRPPLHRRFQLDRPVSASPSGTDAVTRKLRLDLPGGTAETSESGRSGEQLTSSVAPETKIVSNSPKSGRRFRIDNAESFDDVTGTDGHRGRTQTRPKSRFIDEAHESVMRGPHFEVSAPRRSNLTSLTGQFLAYLGVLGLTIGTAIVIYGHFGGYSDYTPTGWLVTTVAQMLLFLGVINLVSGGIEQNNDDVSRRISTLGDQLLRIEQVTSAVLRGPKISPRLYDDPDAATEDSLRDTVMSERE